MIRSIAQRENKKVRFTVQHNDVKVDRKILNEVGDILNHILRNAVSHGIERESDRIKGGKLGEGSVRVDTHIKNNVLLIEVADDGMGMDPKFIGKSAIDKGFRTKEQIEKLTDKEIVELIFEGGFSTTEVADLTSGRGLGLNIVKQKVLALGGSLNYDTEVGKGTTFKIQLPISRSLIRALLISAGEQIYSIALDDIQNLLEISPEDIKEVNGQEYFMYSDAKTMIPLYRLEKIFKLTKKAKEGQNRLKVVHIKKGDKNFALVVDDFIRESEIVIKKIDDIPHDVKGISGAAILDDGKVSLIIDPFSVIN
jgi:two-component system chemotaxis sensor kinase CheA